ncbi:MAG: hypothetical protein AAF108_05075 [Planctomycetota bacterium]
MGFIEFDYDLDIAFATSESGLSQVLFGAEFTNKFTDGFNLQFQQPLLIPSDLASEEYLVGSEPEPPGSTLFDTTNALQNVVNTNGLLLPSGLTQLNTSADDLDAIGVESDPLFINAFINQDDADPVGEVSVVASPGIAAPFTGTLPDPADVNQDGIVNDIVRLSDLTLKSADVSCPENSSIFSPCIGDLNGDGTRSVLDVNALVKLLLGTSP